MLMLMRLIVSKRYCDYVRPATFLCGRRAGVVDAREMRVEPAMVSTNVIYLICILITTTAATIDVACIVLNVGVEEDSSFKIYGTYI